MQIRKMTDLALLIRDQRRKQKMSQAALAQRMGVSRRWVNNVEQGKESAQLGLVIRALDTLGLSVYVEPEQASPVPGYRQPVDIDSVIDRARTPRS